MPKASSDLRISPLSTEGAPLEFTCGDGDLDDFLVSDARRLQGQRVVQTYLATGEGRTLGFVSLMADAVKLATNEKKRLKLRSADHPIVPALKIARLGVCQDMQRLNGIGTALVRFAFFTALDLSETAGCRLLTLDAYPDAIGFYKRLGFEPNRSREYRDKTHPSMRLDVFAPQLPDWA